MTVGNRGAEHRLAWGVLGNNAKRTHPVTESTHFTKRALSSTVLTSWAVHVRARCPQLKMLCECLCLGVCGCLSSCKSLCVGGNCILSMVCTVVGCIPEHLESRGDPRQVSGLPFGFMSLDLNKTKEPNSLVSRVTFP